MKLTTYADRTAFIEPLAVELERIAYRLRQGAISDELAASKLLEITATLKGI